jgi:hypothetical protein
MPSARDIVAFGNSLLRRSRGLRIGRGHTSAFLSRPLFSACVIAAGMLLSACSSVEYPAVHDVPSARPAPTLSPEEQKKVESDLAAARESQRAGNLPPPAVAAAPASQATKPAEAAKKKPAGADSREAAAGNDKKP